MLNPAIFAEFCDAYTQETNRLRMESRANIDAAQTEIEKIGREEGRLMGLYLKADEPPPLLHPAMAQQYRMRVQQLYETLQDVSEEKRIEAAKVIHSLVEDIILTPVDGKLEIDVRGDLAGILTLSVKTQKARCGCGGVASVGGCGGRI